MSRYIIKFYKEGYIRYISHLDLLRLFKRSFKRVGIRLQYSNGYNPHPKMSFAQPLSLGYSSSSEYMEFDTINPYATDEIMDKLNIVMPEGVGIISCEELPISNKTLAALTDRADYEITIPLKSGTELNLPDVIEKYLSQDQITLLKHQRKSGKDVEIDIKPMIFKLEGSVDNNNIMITANIAAGSIANLSPEMVLSTFSEFAGISYDRAEISIKRTEIYFSDQKN